MSAKDRVRFASIAASLRPANAWSHEALSEALLASSEPMPLSISESTVMWASSATPRGILTTSALAEMFTSTTGFRLELPIFTFFLDPENFSVLTTTPYFFTMNDEIVHEIRRAVELSPEDASLHLCLARVLVHQHGSLDEAISEFRQAKRLAPGGGLELEFAAHLFLNGRLNEAITELRGRMSPPDANHHIFLGAVLQKKGNSAAAFKEFREAFLLTKDCCDSTSLKAIAGFLHTTGKPEDEIAVFRERLRSHPEETFAITGLGAIFRSQGKIDEESDVYREAIRLKPDVAKVHGLFAKFLERQGKLDEASVECEKEIALLRGAIRRNPEDAKAHQNYAEALFDRGRWDDALKELREALRIAPSSNPFSNFGERFYSKGKVEKAIALSRESARQKPADAAARNSLGYYLLEFGEADTAVSEIRAALQIEPKNASYLDSLGRALLRGASSRRLWPLSVTPFVWRGNNRQSPARSKPTCIMPNVWRRCRGGSKRSCTARTYRPTPTAASMSPSSAG